MPHVGCRDQLYMARHLTFPPRTRSVGVEIAALRAMARPRLRELLAELGLGPSLLAVVGNVVGRMAHLASEAGDATLAVGAQRAGVLLGADFETMGSMWLHRASDAPRATCSSRPPTACAAVHDPHPPLRSTARTGPLRHAPPALGERPLGRCRPRLRAAPPGGRRGARGLLCDYCPQTMVRRSQPMLGRGCRVGCRSYKGARWTRSLA